MTTNTCIKDVLQLLIKLIIWKTSYYWIILDVFFFLPDGPGKFQDGTSWNLQGTRDIFPDGPTSAELLL